MPSRSHLNTVRVGTTGTFVAVTWVTLLLLPALLGEDANLVTLVNDDLHLEISRRGGSFSHVHLVKDPEKLNPISSIGHIVCVDYFGPPSPSETAAGLQQHGEARFRLWRLESKQKKGVVAKVVMSVELPVAQQKLTRTVSLVDGENVLYVSSVLENLSSIDRPITWAEHGTVGSPFLEPGVTVIDMSGGRSLTRPATPGVTTAPLSRLQPGVSFTWPMAPGKNGSPIDLRWVPREPSSIDITSQRMIPGDIAFATALNTKEHLVFGYVFKPKEFPWLANWEDYRDPTDLHRGLEFAMAPYGMPRREAVSMGKLFDTPTFGWLPAKGRITTSYMMFLSRTPDEMSDVAQVVHREQRLLLRDSKNVELSLPASLQLD